MNNIPNKSDKKKLAKTILTKVNAKKGEIDQSMKKIKKEGNPILDIGKDYRYL